MLAAIGNNQQSYKRNTLLYCIVKVSKNELRVLNSQCLK